MGKNSSLSLLFSSPCPPLPKPTPFNYFLLLLFNHLVVITIFPDNVFIPLLLNLLALQFHEDLAQVIQYLSFCFIFFPVLKVLFLWLILLFATWYSKFVIYTVIVLIYVPTMKLSLHIFHLAVFISVL